MTSTNLFNYSRPINMKIPSIIANDPSQTPKPAQESSTKENMIADRYLEQKVMSARPEELTLMLFDGMIKFLNQVKMYNDQHIIDKSHNSNMRAQDIVTELRATLDMKIEISNSLDSLYDFMLYRLYEANKAKSNAMVDEVLDIARELRDTWKQAFNL